MHEAESIQEYLIAIDQRTDQGKEMNNKIFEDQLILAFRQYTRGIISYNNFVTLDEESRYKFMGDEIKRIEYLLSVEDMSYDAMIYFTKCLQTMPDLNMSAQ